MILGIDGSSPNRRPNFNPISSKYTLVDESFDETEEFDIDSNSSFEVTCPEWWNFKANLFRALDLNLSSLYLN